jgi:hypothetical protein
MIGSPFDTPWEAQIYMTTNNIASCFEISGRKARMGFVYFVGQATSTAERSDRQPYDVLIKINYSASLS